jgi:hypothetical protein
LSTAQPAAGHPPARAPRAADENSSAEESLQHHATRLAQSRLHAVERAILDPIIGLLQRLRRGTGTAEGGDEAGDEDRPKSRKARPAGHDAAAHEEEGEEQAAAPKPRRRLLSFLIYFSVLLAGGMIGGALAYDLLSKMLERQATESRRLEAAMAKQTKTTGANEKKLEEALAKRVEAEKKLEEAKKKQTEAEKKLETALNDTKASAEKQKKLDDAVKLLEQIRGPERSGAAQRALPAGSSAAGGGDAKARPPKTGDCTLAAGDVKSLKDCVKEFNR